MRCIDIAGIQQLDCASFIFLCYRTTEKKNSMAIAFATTAYLSTGRQRLNTLSFQ
jgi:ABC-type transporter Mla MlaB component